MSQPKIIFIIAKDNAAKLQGLIQVALNCYHHQTRILFSVASQEAAQYIDELLWKFSPESFLPHAIIDQPSSELIAISTGLHNYNQATVLFNLRPEPNPLIAQFPLTYDFFDESHPSKKELSEKRKALYEQHGFLLDYQ